MSNTPSLLPCPFCGGINIIHCGHHMYCHACGADGPDADSQHESEARSAWNRRTPHPDVASGYADGWQDGMSEATRLLTEADGSDQGTPQPVVREPLTREQVKAIMAEAGYDREAPQPRADFISGLRHGERAHGITQKGGD